MQKLKSLATAINILMGLTLSNAYASKAITSDQIVGTWELRFSNDYGYDFSQIGFTANGRKCVISFNFDHRGQLTTDYWDNKYTIENGILVTEVTFSSTRFLKKGLIIKDRIDVLTDDYLEVFMIKPSEGPGPEQHQRLDGVPPEKICKVVNNYKIAKQKKSKSKKKSVGRLSVNANSNK